VLCTTFPAGIECSETYIGQTGRLLGTWLADHRATVKYAKTDVSAVTEHVWERQHYDEP